MTTTAHDLIGYDGDQYSIRIVGGRALYDTALVPDGYVDGPVRLARIETSDGIRQINRYVAPDTLVELVDRDGSVPPLVEEVTYSDGTTERIEYAPMDASEGFGYWPGEDTRPRRHAGRARVRATRRWTVELGVAGQSCPVDLDDVRDTLVDTRRAAIAEATSLIRDYELGSDASVTVFKTTAAHGTERHSSAYVYRSDDGDIRVQR